MQHSLPLKNLLEPIRQPTGLAILASLGIHGIVGLSFESLPIFAKTPKEKDNAPVRMVQLNPEQLSRIQPPPRTELTLPLLPPPGSATFYQGPQPWSFPHTAGEYFGARFAPTTTCHYPYLASILHPQQ